MRDLVDLFIRKKGYLSCYLAGHIWVNEMHFDLSDATMINFQLKEGALTTVEF